ncbi:UNVERIFIED_CONTAM: hypothetical protein Sradi_2036500 [Sesamum radiatum]|uniref:Retrotransposon Copia-like N-terminal domain-containing protein n=1 Tax=Sesamum radiatum TaxID=300843 RepID=A0AAW2TI52_SESRA
MATDSENGGSAAVGGSDTRREPNLPDYLQLHGGDNPGMVLVSAPFDGTDFLAWRRSVMITPSEDETWFHRWKIRYA